MDSTDALIVHGCVDREGRLSEADPPLLALQQSAGGERGGVLVIPQLENLVRMARSLGLLVSRSVIAADGDNDVDLWVAAQPEGDAVRLRISGWTRRRPLVPGTDVVRARALDFARLEADGTWSVDAALTITALSVALDPVLPHPLDEAIGKPLMRIMVLASDDQGEMPMLIGAMKREAFANQWADVRGAQHASLRLSAVPRYGTDGAFTGFDGTYQFVDRKLVAPVPSDVASNADSGFVGRLDRALRTSITKIIKTADNIGSAQEGPLRHNYIGYAHDIAAAGRHLLGLVDDLADLQAVELPTFAIEPQMVDLADIARRAAGLLRVRAADRAVRIDAPPSDEAVMAKGDFRRCLQVMVNLLSNAVRYSPPGSQIWLRTEREGDLAAVIVADQGKGIAVDDQARIFEKFERVDPAEAGGSGLGLYISRRLARAMGGDLSVDSAPGRGARFIFTLPADPR